VSKIGKALRTKLLSYAAVSTLLGQRIYTDVLVQGAALPAAVFTKTSTEREETLDGTSKLAHARFTFDACANTRDTASSVSTAIRETGIDIFRGVVESHTFCGIDFTSGDSYFIEPPTDGNQEHRYWVSFDLLVHYKEP
jgi:hypothetical protein